MHEHERGDTLESVPPRIVLQMTCEGYGFLAAFVAALPASFMAPLASSTFLPAVSIFALAVSIFIAAIAESVFAVVSTATGAGAGAIAGAAVSAFGVSFVLQAATSTTATRARRFM